MFKNYIQTALRNILKNKLYAGINIFGLAIGLTIYFLGGVLADYERNHDTMFANHERTYTIGTYLSPNNNVGVKEFDNAYTAFGPHLKANIPEIEYMARTERGSYLMSIGDKHFYDNIKFADKELLQIFDFNFIHGDASALNDASSIVLTRTTAEKLFGRVDVIGENIELNHEHSLQVSAVIEDVPQNSHFNSSFIAPDPLGALASFEAFARIEGQSVEGNWNNISTGNYIYVMLKEPLPLAEIEQKLAPVFANHAPELVKEGALGLKARQLKDTNTAVWDMVGMPVIESIQILGAIVLLIAIVNYTNLAMAQSMKRTREVGIRKTHGAQRSQLLTQFLMESFVVTAFAVLLAVVFLELLVPQINTATGKVVSLDYLTMLPWLIGTTAFVGLLAGLYPSYLITKVNPIDTLNAGAAKGVGGSLFRSMMVGTQFMLAIFVLALVMIIYFQNQKVEETSNVFPKDEVVALDGMDIDAIRKREPILRAELLKLADVRSVSFASQVPFMQRNSWTQVVRKKGDVEAKFLSNTLSTDHDFLKTFDIPLVAGRDFSREISADENTSDEVSQSNVIVNELLASKLGFAGAADALGQTFWGVPDSDGRSFQYDIVGVVASQNILGLHNDVKPWIFTIDSFPHQYGAVRLKAGFSPDAVAQIEEVWKRVIPDYPIQHQFLDGLFQEIYKVYQAMNTALAVFAGVALLLAFIGLFGLAAFMAESRTKEIGLRKVLGATSQQIVKLLIWQFSKPVMWSILFAIPLAYFASSGYLQFFSDRIVIQIPIILLSGVMAVVVAWVVIAVHAIAVARTSPVRALRYE